VGYFLLPTLIKIPDSANSSGRIYFDFFLKVVYNLKQKVKIIGVEDGFERRKE
jgi:hypothetical protein